MMTIYTRKERINQIVDAVKTGTGRGDGMTMRQVARRLGLKPSGYVMEMLWDCVDAGALKADPFQHRRNMMGWKFTSV